MPLENEQATTGGKPFTPVSDISRDLIRIIDGDTVEVNGNKSRVNYIDTPESVHADESKNTPEGQRASSMMKDFIPSDSDLTIESESKDKFGRDLSTVKRKIGDTELDWGLIALDQDLSMYETKYGTAPADIHDVYKEYYSKYSPYQYGEIVEPMPEGKFQEMVGKYSRLNSAYKSYKDTDDRNELDASLVALYSNPQDVAHFRALKMQHIRQKESPDGSLMAAYQLAEQDPDFREKYNRVVREGGLPRQSVNQPKIDDSFLGRLGATFQQTSMLTNLKDKHDLDIARQTKDMSIPLNDVLQGVDEKYVSRVQQEYASNGAIAAWTYKEQLAEDIENNKVFDNLPLHKQLGYGALAILSDPSSYVTGGIVGKGATAAVGALKAMPLIQNKAAAEVGTTIATWGVAAGIEGAVYDAPRLLEGDLTYTGTDYLATIAMSTAFGTGLSSVLIGGGKYLDSKALKDSQVKFTDDLNKHILESNKPKKEKEPTESVLTQVETNESTVAKDISEGKEITPEVKEEMKQATLQLQEISKVTPVDTSLVEVGDLFDVPSIDRELFNKVLNMSRTKMDANSPVFNFMKRQAKLNKMADEFPQLKEEADKLNAEIVKIASAFPDGKIPYEYKKVIDEVRMGQQRWITNNAMEDILGDVTNKVQLLDRYVNKLKTMDLFDGDVQPVSWLELAQYVPSMFDIARHSDGFRIELPHSLQKEVRFLEDVVKLNNDAIKSKDIHFRSLVEELNGMVANRITQLEMKVLPDASLKTADKTKYLPKTVKLTPDEIRTKLKEEGIDQYTPEYRQALAQAKEDMAKQVTPDMSTKQSDTVRRAITARLERMVKEGQIVKQNPQYVARKKELESGKVEVEQEVREVGRQDVIREQGQLIDDDRPNRFDDVMLSDESKTGADTLDFRVDKPEQYSQDTIFDPVGEAGDLLPRKFNEPVKFDAYNNPTPETLKYLREQLQTRVTAALKDKIDAGNKLRADQKVLMSKVANGLMKDPVGTVKKAVESGKLDSVFAVIRASKEVSNMNKNKLANKQVQEATDSIRSTKETEVTDKKTTIEQYEWIEDPTRGFTQERSDEYQRLLKELEVAKKKLSDLHPNVLELQNKVQEAKDLLTPRKIPVKKEQSPKELTEEDVAAVVNDLDTRTDVEKAEITKVMKSAYQHALEKKLEEASKEIARFVEVEKPWFDAATKVKHFGDWVGRKLSFLTKDIAEKLQTSNNTAMNYIGHRVLEMGRGYGGGATRQVTGGLVKHKVVTDLQMDFMPAYVKAMHDYAGQKGANSFQTMNAQQMMGANNPIVKQFNRDFLWLQEMRRTGKKIPTDKMGALKHIIKFADEWDSMMAKAHKYLVDANIEGFTAKRKINNYVPRVHRYANYMKAINERGEENVRKLIAQAIRNADTFGLTKLDVDKKASEFIDWVKKQDGTTPVEDMFMPEIDSRAMSRLEMDMTTEIDGLSMFDLVNDEIMELGMKYTNRVAGWVGLSESTNGLLNSNAAIDAFKGIVETEGKLDNAKVLFDDVINMMFGRPTRNGLAEEVRMFKDLTALTRMGGLGSAQLIESGQVLTRSMINMFSDPAVAKRLFAVAKENPDDLGLLKEIQSISKLTDDMEWLQRQSVNLEQTENIGISPWRRMSTKLADTMTFGSYKAPASRLLGKVTGFNAIRRYQSRVAQTSFTLNTIRHFTNGSSAISPKRLADLGLTDTKGKNTELADTIKKFVELDSEGFPTKLNFDKWPKNVRDQFQYALLRDEAQNVQKSLVGELPAWYNKPLMALVFQFRQFPIVAQNKQLGRALALADKEAVIATMMNAATAGIVRLSKAALIAGGITAVSNSEYRFNSDPEHLVRDTSKYIAQFGILPDATDFVMKAYESYDDDGFSTDFGDTLLSFAPIWGLMKDYKDVANPDSSRKERIDATFGTLPLGNILFADMLKAQAQETLAE